MESTEHTKSAVQKAPEKSALCGNENNQNGQIIPFLKNLLPSKIDVYDLIIIGVLLLINREEKEFDLAPMLTIALYFLL